MDDCEPLLHAQLFFRLSATRPTQLLTGLCAPIRSKIPIVSGRVFSDRSLLGFYCVGWVKMNLFKAFIQAGFGNNTEHEDKIDAKAGNREIQGRSHAPGGNSVRLCQSTSHSLNFRGFYTTHFRNTIKMSSI